MKKILTTKKRIVIAGAAAAVVLGSGGAAFAFYTSSGSGTGSATAGTVGTSDWGVTQASSTGTLYPVPQGASSAVVAANSATITFTVTNNGHGAEAFSGSDVTAALASTVPGDAETATTDSGGHTTFADIPNCSAGWFTATVPSGQTAFGTSIAPGATASVAVTVTMNDSGTNQDACAGQTPAVNLAINKS